MNCLAHATQANQAARDVERVVQIGAREVWATRQERQVGGGRQSGMEPADVAGYLYRAVTGGLIGQVLLAQRHPGSLMQIQLDHQL